jgi:hypothetical protein
MREEAKHATSGLGADLFGWAISTKSPRLVFWADRAWIGLVETGTTLTTLAGTGACENSSSDYACNLEAFDIKSCDG